MKKLLVLIVILVFFSCGGLDKKWAKKIEFAGSGDYRIYDASGVYLAGSFNKEADSACSFLASYNDEGNFMWAGLFKNPDIKSSRAKQIIEIYHRVYILVEGSDISGKSAIFVAEYDYLSNMLWNKKIMESVPGKEISGTLFCDPRGNIYVGGSLFNKKDSLVTFIAKIRSTGEIAWGIQYYNPQMDIYGPKFGIGDGSQAVIAGISRNKKDFFYLRYDSLGNLIGTKLHENPAGDENMLAGVVIDRNKIVYVLAASKSDSTATDFLTAAYGENDSLLWTQVYSGQGDLDDIPKKLILDDSLNVYVFGAAQDSGSVRIVSIRYDNEGSEVWRRVYQDKEKDIAEPFLIGPFYHIVCSAGNDILMLEYSEHGFLKMNKRFRQGKGKNVPIAFSNNYLVLENHVGETTEHYIVKFEPSQLGFFRWD